MIDGMASLDDLTDASGMPAADVARSHESTVLPSIIAHQHDDLRSLLGRQSRPRTCARKAARWPGVSFGRAVTVLRRGSFCASLRVLLSRFVSCGSTWRLR
jgi:hypothetical protein